MDRFMNFASFVLNPPSWKRKIRQVFTLDWNSVMQKPQTSFHKNTSFGFSTENIAFFVSAEKKHGNFEKNLKLIIVWIHLIRVHIGKPKMAACGTDAFVWAPWKILIWESQNRKIPPGKCPGKCFGLKFIPRQSDSFWFIPKSVSAPIRTPSNQSEKKFSISFDVIRLKINPSQSESIRDF